MDNALDYFGKLRNDLLEQFKGKPNIEIFQRALADQLDELNGFFSALNTLRWLQEAEGVQLDGIGDIVVLSRAEALVLSELAGVYVPMNDENYRLYLTLKIHINTNNCTHVDLRRALRMFWGKTPIFYAEKVECPATIFLTVPASIFDKDIGVLNIAGKIKAAGVALHYVFTGDAFTINDYSAGAISELIKDYLISDLEPIQTDVTDYQAGVSDLYMQIRFSDEKPMRESTTSYDAATSGYFITEVWNE